MCMKDEVLLSLILKCYKESMYPFLRLPALRFLGNIWADDDILARKLIIDHELLVTMEETIQDPNRFLRRETCWVAANLVWGPVSNVFLVLKSLLKHVQRMYLHDEPKIKLEASWILLNSTQKINEKTVNLMLKYDVIGTFEQKIIDSCSLDLSQANVKPSTQKKLEIEENISEAEEDIVLTFLEEFLKKTMRFPVHKEIKQRYRESPLMLLFNKLFIPKRHNNCGLLHLFIKPLALKRREWDNGMKAYDLIARYFKDIKEELLNPEPTISEETKE